MERFEVGVNDLATLKPEVAAEWHPTKNGDLKPTDLRVSSNKKVWWQCKLGHEWLASPNSRRNTDCPYCKNRYVLKGYNDLATVYPDVASEWCYEKNGNLTPDMITSGAEKKVWWKCPVGHEYQMLVYSRTSKQRSGCPYCVGKKILPGFNDLGTLDPNLAKEWHSVKNGNLQPTDVGIGSNKKVWWICDYGHEWQASIRNRHGGRGCPICNAEGHTSFPEQAVYYYIKRHFPDAVNRDISFNMELDVYIPSIRTGIEYDGSVYHSTPEKIERDKKKNVYFKEKGVRLIRIREDGCYPIDVDDVIERHGNKDEFSLIESILKVLNMLGVFNDVVYFPYDSPFILDSYVSNKKDRSLAVVNPELAAEWHPTKNGLLTPDKVMAKSGKKVWWQCKLGHEWQADIENRMYGRGCPYCGNKKLLVGFNDLASREPDIAKNWHPTKNGDLKPSSIRYTSNEKVWWLGECGHEWQASPYNQSKSVGCPYCSDRKLLSGFNDFETVHPNLAKEWHPTKNGGLKPSMVTKGNGRKVWWLCPCGHEWMSTVYNRRLGNGCPVCAGRKPRKYD